MTTFILCEYLQFKIILSYFVLLCITIKILTMCFSTTSDPSDGYSNHFSNAPDIVEENQCPKCESPNTFKGTYFEASAGTKRKKVSGQICRSCWFKF